VKSGYIIRIVVYSNLHVTTEFKKNSYNSYNLTLNSDTRCLLLEVAEGLVLLLLLVSFAVVDDCDEAAVIVASTII
jgi:hypothetical protein